MITLKNTNLVTVARKNNTDAYIYIFAVAVKMTLRYIN